MAVPDDRDQVLLRAAGPADLPRPERSDAAEPSTDGVVRIGVPRDYAALRRVDRGLAGAWRDATGEVFAECFAHGLEVVAFDADLDGGYPLYALAAPDAIADWPEDVAWTEERIVKVRRVELRLVGLPLVRPFRTSFGTSTEKVCVLVRVETDDAEGWGECVADIEPGFSEEFNEGAWLVMRDFLVPALFAAGDVTIDRLDEMFAFVRGNPMAKATLINACLDAELRARDDVAGLVPGRRTNPRGVRGVGGHHRHDRATGGPGRRATSTTAIAGSS